MRRAQHSDSLRHFARLAVRWMLRMAPLFALIALPATTALAGNEAEPATTAADKRGFTLFHPTPEAQMRELAPDRPDKTESPFTVDAGHFQLEMDFATFTQDRADGVRTRAWNVAPVNLKVGLLNNVDLQFVFDSYLHVRTEDRAARSTAAQSGIGDLTTRLKINLWGNDGGTTAFALLPFIKFPTSTDRLGNGTIEGGLLLPLSVKLPAGFEASVETGASILRNDDDWGYHAEFVNSISVGHSLIGKMSGYVEFFSSISTARHTPWVGT